MLAANPAHPVKARPTGTRVSSGERLTQVVRRVVGLRASGAGRRYCRPSAGAPRRPEAVTASWPFTMIEHPLAIAALPVDTTGSRLGSSQRALPASAELARRSDTKDSRAQMGAGRPRESAP